MKVKILFIFLFIIITYYLVFINDTKEALKEKADKVLVIKHKREMYLIKNKKVIRTYKIALGDQPISHKIMEGDERTPEGNYTLDWRNSKSNCYKSIHISYPNKADIELARRIGVSPGGDIMIHGLHPAIQYLGKFHINSNWTNGCIAVTNDEMDEIWNAVKYGTPIEIR